MRWLRGAMVVAMVLIAGCGDADEPAVSATGTVPGGGAVTPGGGAAMGPGLSIAEALTTTADGPLLVRGFLVARGNVVQLCEALAESHPPQCGGGSLTVEGLDIEQRDDLEEAEGTRWSAAEITLLGEMTAGTLTVDPSATG
ncbi:MAG: hypothetical protein WEB13_03555 [Dehalococcoidia bacterium]